MAHFLKKKNRYLLTGFTIGSIIVSIVWLIVGFSLLIRPKVKVANNNIIAPYYDPKVFQPPKLRPVREASTSAKIPIIMYHYVEYVQDVNDLIRKRLDITPNIFSAELKALHDNNFDTYFVRDIPDILGGRIDYNASRSAVLTFDDGYEDFYYDVFPILKKYQMKATIFVIYDYVGRRGFMNEKEIREVLDSGLVELGSHTFDHYYLKKAPLAAARHQIIDSKKAFEDRFGVKIKTFAYPYGAFDQSVIDTVKEATYSAAVSVIPGTIQSDTNLFYLYRIRPGNFTPATIVSFLENYNK